jgi:membrane-associated phospholipid phosphatase
MTPAIRDRLPLPAADIRQSALEAVCSIRNSEWLLLAYFVAMLAASACVHGSADLARRGGAVAAGACLVFLLAWLERRAASLLISCVRDWLSTALILVAYWAVDWFPAPPGPTAFDRACVGFDRVLLWKWGGKAAVESFGALLPSVLELSYTSLYAVAPLSVGILYWCRRRCQVDLFLSVLLLGTLSAYALLPFSPSMPPHVAFPGRDLPAQETPFRLFNLWLLGKYDIHRSVFPSGHVTVGFSAAFAMLVAMPEKRRFSIALFILAVLVLGATVYGRYHYTADGLAGLGISLMAFTAAVFSRQGRPTQ